MLAVDSVVHAAHLVGRDLAAQFVERLADLGVTRQRLAAHDGDSLVRREVVPVVLEDGHVERGDQSVGRAARNQIHLLLLQSAIEQPQIHDARRRRELESVGARQALIPVGPLHELVAESGAPLGRVARRFRDGVEIQAPRVRAADYDGERIVEAQGLRHDQSKPPRILLFDARIDLGRVALRLLLENRRARVLRVNIDAPRENRLVADVAAREVEAPLNEEVGARFQMLGNQFAENGLLGEVLRADHDAINARRPTGSEQSTGENREADAAHGHWEARRRRSTCPNTTSAARASSAAGTAPARIRSLLTMARPRKMYSPKPPAPIAAAIVATPTEITVATRTPAMMTPSASGNSTWKSNWRSVIPMPRPASTTARSTPVIPACVLRMMGSSA